MFKEAKGDDEKIKFNQACRLIDYLVLAKRIGKVPKEEIDISENYILERIEERDSKKGRKFCSR